MANTFTGINNDIVANSVLLGFQQAVAPLTALSTDFSPAAAAPGDRVSVPRMSGAIVAAADKAVGSAYAMQDSTSDAVEILLNKHKYVSVEIADIESANTSVPLLEKIGERKGNQLAATVVADILSAITAANFGAAAFTGAASTFDEDDVADIAAACDADNMPENDRYLLLKPAYISALRKAGAIKDTTGYGYNAIQTGQVPMLHGFKVIMSNLIPANGENLVGFATDGSGIVSAFRYLAPQQGHTYSRAEPFVGEGGVTLGLRDYYSNDIGSRRVIFESLYGYAVGLAAGVKRLVSA